MKTNAFRQTVTRKLLVLALPLVLLLGFAATSAEARDFHRGRSHRGDRHAYENRGYNGRGYYRHDNFRGRRHHDGYWRYRRGHRYWYEDGGYYVRPGGLSINIGF